MTKLQWLTESAAFTRILLWGARATLQVKTSLVVSRGRSAITRRESSMISRVGTLTPSVAIFDAGNQRQRAISFFGSGSLVSDISAANTRWIVLRRLNWNR